MSNTAQSPSSWKQNDLDVLDQVLTDVEQKKQNSIAQAIPKAVMQSADQQHSFVGSAHKEGYVGSIPEVGDIHMAEQEKVPEISPEVESFLQKAEDHADQLPQEIVVADNQKVSTVTHYPKTPVIVLPITQSQQARGKKKNPKYSFRWLVELSIKLIKKFSGKVIYRKENAN